MGEATIPGRYSVTRSGTGAEIGAAWSEFIGATLRNSGNRLDSSRNSFEHYPRGASG